uniref:Uncharacterized protein n=1 Tax=Setaria viridis TaxID=4556 RepID=A0A4U6U6E5_SETVI|nr:hypothetical protein SEVIR_6G125400v2 [Setaria viridis]
MKPSPTEQASGSASASSASKRRLFLEPPPPVNSSTLAPFPTPGSKRSSESLGKDLVICLSVSSASATPASSPSQALICMKDWVAAGRRDQKIGRRCHG